jgi:MFS family permease
MAVGLLSVGNSIGRVAGGIVFDRWGHAVTIAILSVLFCSCAIMFAVFYPALILFPVIAALFLTGIWYGGVSTISAAFMSKVFGRRHFSSNMGFNSLINVPFTLLLSWLISFIKVRTGAYTSYFYVMLVIGIIASAAAAITPRLIRKMSRTVAAKSFHHAE